MGTGDVISGNKARKLARFVRDRRRAIGLSQSAVEERAGLAPRTLSNVETGRSGLPTAEHRRRLARALGVGHAELLVMAGELTSEEVIEAARALGDPDPESGQGTKGWVGVVAERLAGEREGAPRSRLVQQALWATQEEATCLLAVFENLPWSAATEARQELSWSEYCAWRAGPDAGYLAAKEL